MHARREYSNRPAHRGRVPVEASKSRRRATRLYSPVIKGAELDLADEDTSAMAAAAMSRVRQILAKVTDPAIIRLYACPLLVLQNSALFLVMKQSTSLHDDHYHTTVAVLMQEILKLLSCLIMLIFSAKSLVEPLSTLWTLRSKMMPLIIPAVCYTGQNNLLYLGVSCLPAAVAQVLVQTKLLWAAVFSIVLLHKKFSKEAWCSFVLLVVGVILVKNGDASKSGGGGGGSPIVGAAFIGVLASVGAAGLSGFAGVYLEKTFNKGTASLLQMNVWLAIISLPLQALAMFEFDREGILANGLFHGFHPDTWGVIFIQAIGGLLTAVVIKFAGNILKGFATAFALMSTSLISIPMLGFMPTAVFWVGLLAVCVSTMMYSTSPVTALLKRLGYVPADPTEAANREKRKFNRLEGETPATPIAAAEELEEGSTPAKQ